MKIGKPKREVFIDPLPEFMPEPLRVAPDETPEPAKQPAEEPAKTDGN